ncbi:Ms5788A family Cys-rich leader peptide [Virgisporangium ochraceum]|uniref:Ms5788A family Cys-rich leader peptide n=1 Tax=Virgisporangium ochraceum TaxID=65505 RepID=UPI0035A24080
MRSLRSRGLCGAEAPPSLVATVRCAPRAPQSRRRPPQSRSPGDGPMLGFSAMSMLLTKRRAVDLCRVGSCLCCRH